MRKQLVNGAVAFGLLAAIGILVASLRAQDAPKSGTKERAPKKFTVKPKSPPAEKPAGEEVPGGKESDPEKTDSGPFKTAEESASYALGLNIGRDLKGNIVDRGVQLDIELITSGLADAMSGAEPKLDERQAAAALQGLQKLFADAVTAMAARNQKEGATFLADNGKRKGVTTTKSGLQYEVIESGDAKGKSPKASDTVSAHYHGTLINGEVFDSSVERGEPLEIQVNRVIAGWTEALQLMKPGDKWKLYIPGDLAYGADGSPPKIQPNTTLIFEVELLEVVKASPPKFEAPPKE